MKILFWVPYPSEGASNRYRVEQFLPFLDKQKLDYTLHCFWRKKAFSILYKKGFFLRKTFYFIGGTLSRFIDILRLRRYDMVFIHREAYPVGGPVFEWILYKMKVPYVFDFDDAIFLPSSSSTNGFIERFKNPGKVPRIIKMSSCVIAGNKYLADYAGSFNDNVTIIPTCIDTDKFRPGPADQPDPGGSTVGWMGSTTTAGFLEPLKGVFRSLSKALPGVRFRIVGADLEVKGVERIECRPWRMDTEMRELSAFDIGIMPMPDNRWTRGKCAFKAILYMSMGIPCVSSAVGVNKEIVRDGYNGFIAANDDEWFQKIKRLAEDIDLRRRLGSAGRQTVEDNFSLAVNAPKFIEVLERTLKKC